MMREKKLQAMYKLVRQNNYYDKNMLQNARL